MDNDTEILEKSKASTDEEIVDRVRAGDLALYEVIMRRYNQRLYRVARAILHNDAEAEDVMQDAYVRAYTHLDQFAGRAPFSTWLTRIAVHEALARLRSRNRIPGGRYRIRRREIDEDDQQIARPGTERLDGATERVSGGSGS